MSDILNAGAQFAISSVDRAISLHFAWDISNTVTFMYHKLQLNVTILNPPGAHCQLGLSNLAHGIELKTHVQPYLTTTRASAVDIARAGYVSKNYNPLSPSKPFRA